MGELRGRGAPGDGEWGDHEVAEVLKLAEAAEDADGVGPLSEHSMLALRGGHPGLALSDSGVGGGSASGSGGGSGGIVAYAHLDPATAEEPAAGELVVHPEHRRRGHGRALLRALRDEAGGPLRVWAHGDLPAAAALAASEGMTRVRVLLQMRRPAAAPLPEMTVAPGVTLRTFEPGRDERAWLDVNSRAFADHPEQGAWTIEDVRDREREDWFDPSGFFLAERPGERPGERPAERQGERQGERRARLAGFHWTKIHPGGIGEVYVVGVDPDAQGLGLGRTLTLKGLHHLRDVGVDQIMLYVDESNTAAVRLYESLGFTRHAVDVMYATHAS